LVGNLNQRKYVIIVGSKGSGKTTLLKHVLNGKKGIVFVKFDGKTTLENLENKLLETINVHIEPWNQSNFFKNLLVIFR
jgi:predicted ATPase